MTGLDDWPATVTFQPGMRSGQPTIGGTRLPLATVLHALWHGGVEYTREGWGPTREQCLVAAWFAGMYGIADTPTGSGRLRPSPWRKRYGDWARQHKGNLWSLKFDLIPDPPSEGDA